MEVGQAVFLYGMRGGEGSRTGLESWLKCFAHSFSGAESRGHEQYTLFATGSSEIAIGWGFCNLLVSFCPEYAPTAHAAVIFSPHVVSLYFVARGEVCPGASTSKGSRVPAYQRLSTAGTMGSKEI